MTARRLPAPRRLSDGALQGLFVQREPVVERLVERLVEGARHGERHHLLLVGPDGSGTSHLAERVARRVEAANPAGLRVLRLPEIGDRSASWPHLLRALVEGLEGREPGAPWGLDDDDGWAGAADARDDEAREAALLERWREALGERSLLVVLEGLDDLFAALGRDGQHGLRGFLQTAARCALLATAPRPFPGVSERDAPCFGLFSTTYMDALEDDALLELVARRRAWITGGAADDGATPVEGAAVSALVPLLGRWPRPWALLAESLAAGSDLPEAVVDVVAALRPGARAALRQLSPQQRLLVLRLADRGGAAPVKRVARDGGLSEQTAARQLGDLRAAGWVVGERVGRETWYELADPLVRWALLLDRPSDGARLAAVVRWLLAEGSAHPGDLADLLRDAEDTAATRDALAERARADGAERLGRRVLATARRLVARTTSDVAAASYRAAWDELAAARPELRPVAAWVAVLAARRDADDPRPRLCLPAEQRALLDRALAG